MKSRYSAPSGWELSEAFSPVSFSLVFFFFFQRGVPYWSWIRRETASWSLIQTRAPAPAPVQLWYLLKFRERTRHSQPAGPGRHDNPNYLPLQPRFWTGRRPLCSSGICISLRQVLKVGERSEITRNTNTPEQNVARSRKKKRKVTHGNTSDTLTGISIVKHFINYSLKHVFPKTFQSSAGGRGGSAEVWLNHLFVLWDVFRVVSLAIFFLRARHPVFPIKPNQAAPSPLPENTDKLEKVEKLWNNHPSTRHNYFLL